MKYQCRAQCAVETGYGENISEVGSESYFAKKPYDSKYRGTGYMQMTYTYAYQAYAIFKALEAYPALGNDGVVYKNPASNDSKTISNMYDKMVQVAKQKGYDIKSLTDIYDKGYVYVAANYAWDSAGYYWYVNGLNTVADSAKGKTDPVTRIVNKWTNTYNERQTAYDKIKLVIK